MGGWWLRPSPPPIGRHEDRRIGLPLDVRRTAHVLENAFAGAKVYLGAIPLEPHHVVLYAHVIAGHGLVGGVVEFDVIGAEGHFLVANFDVAIRDNDTIDQQLD